VTGPRSTETAGDTQAAEDGRTRVAVSGELRAAVADERDAWRLRWSRRRWAYTLALSAVSGVIFGLSIDWWLGPIMFVVLPCVLVLRTVQDRMEWIGYAACPNCKGFGRIWVSS
jgi:hypothetical protein